MENYLKDKQIIISTEEYNLLKETEKEYIKFFKNADKNEKNIVIKDIESLFLMNGFYEVDDSIRHLYTNTTKRPELITGEENIRKYFLDRFNEFSKYIEKYEVLKIEHKKTNEKVAELTFEKERIKSKYWLIRKFKF